MDRASRLDAAELLHDALDRRRHLAQLVDVRVAQVIDVCRSIRSGNHDLLFARVLTYARDALSSLQRLCGRAARTEGLTHFIVRHPQHFTMTIGRGLHQIEVLHLADVFDGNSSVGLELQYFV